MFISFVVLSLMMLPATDPPKDKEKEKKAELSEAAKKELKKLEGKWQLVKVVASDREAELKGEEALFAFEGNKMTITENGKTILSAEITAVDLKTDPKCIDITENRPNRPARTSEAVFKLDGDTLLIANTPNGDKLRPANFDKPTDARVVVWTLKRIKE